MTPRRALHRPSPVTALVAVAVVVVVLPALLVALAGAAGPDAADADAGSCVSAAPLGAGSRAASLAQTVRLEAWAPAPSPCDVAPVRAAPTGDAAPARGTEPYPVPSPAEVARRL